MRKKTYVSECSTIIWVYSMIEQVQSFLYWSLSIRTWHRRSSHGAYIVSTRLMALTAGGHAAETLRRQADERQS